MQNRGQHTHVNDQESTELRNLSRKIVTLFLVIPTPARPECASCTLDFKYKHLVIGYGKHGVWLSSESNYNLKKYFISLSSNNKDESKSAAKIFTLKSVKMRFKLKMLKGYRQDKELLTTVLRPIWGTIPGASKQWWRGLMFNLLAGSYLILLSVLSRIPAITCWFQTRNHKFFEGIF